MDELNIAEQYIRSSLLQSVAVTDFIGDRIFDEPPPRGTRYPYILYSLSTTQDVRGTGTIRIMATSIYTVKAVAETDDLSVLSPLARAVDDAITLAQPEAVTGGTVQGCVRERIVRFKETSEGQRFAHLGGEYTIITQTT